MNIPMPGGGIYIKLGRGGDWADGCIKNGKLRLGFDKIRHTDCMAGKWEAVRSAFRRQQFDKTKSTQQTNELRSFYESQADVLWLTIHDNFLWWCFSERNVTPLKRGGRTRPVDRPWRDKNHKGDELRLEDLDACLADKRFFQGTLLHLKGAEESCAIETIFGFTKSDGKHSGQVREEAAKKSVDNFSAANLNDERERCIRDIVARRGQNTFRSALIQAYNGRCRHPMER